VGSVEHHVLRLICAISSGRRLSCVDIFDVASTKLTLPFSFQKKKKKRK